MLNRATEDYLREQVNQGKPVSNVFVVSMLETIDALRAQVEQLQIDLQQAQAQNETEVERWDAAQSALDALNDKIKQYSGLNL